ncbi:unnamed protein product [Dibothriocephalus latus]|uniref:Uncharacterized protein n=1 Tax=Dibothriocephalus latus TaxID=60516 RepID=A0A3P7NMV3_DIBLA|nr:unnamed protein product [Dibothriocephalus latus]
MASAGMLWGIVLTSLLLIPMVAGFCILRETTKKSKNIALWDKGEIIAPEPLTHSSAFRIGDYDCSNVDDRANDHNKLFVHCCYLGNLDDDAPLTDEENRRRLQKIFFKSEEKDPKKKP